MIGSRRHRKELRRPIPCCTNTLETRYLTGMRDAEDIVPGTAPLPPDAPSRASSAPPVIEAREREFDWHEEPDFRPTHRFIGIVRQRADFSDIIDGIDWD